MNLYQQRLFDQLSAPGADDAIRQQMGYGSGDLVSLIRMCQKAESQRLDRSDVDALCRMHSAVPRDEIQRRVDELNSLPAGRGRMEHFVGAVTLGGPEAIESSLSLVDSFHQFDTASQISARLDDRQQAVDTHAGRQASATRNETPGEPSLRDTIRAAALTGQQMPDEARLADQLAERIDASRGRLQLDREDGDSDRSLRDTVADAVSMYSDGALAQDLGLVQEP